MIPEVGKEYYFFDDGKISSSRCYKAKVLRIIPYDECEEIFDTYDHDQNIPKSLKEIHKDEVENCSTLDGTPQLYSKETDYFIECSIPEYDKHNIWFVRTIDGGWFSMDIESDWQSGRLDIKSSLYCMAKKHFDELYGEGWYDKQIAINNERKQY